MSEETRSSFISFKPRVPGPHSPFPAYLPPGFALGRHPSHSCFSFYISLWASASSRVRMVMFNSYLRRLGIKKKKRQLFKRQRALPFALKVLLSNFGALRLLKNSPGVYFSSLTGWSESGMKSGTVGFPGGSEVKASACNAGNLGSIPGSGRSPGEGNGNPLQYSCLENPMEKEMASHSSILAWKIPWTEEPGRLQNTGSQKIERN